MIEIQNLSKSYGQIKAVKDITFTVEKGEILGFLGPNGAGKSTTMNIITGCLSSTEGTVKVCGDDIMEDSIKAKKHIGYLPEQPPLYMDMTVSEYLSFVGDLKKVDKQERIVQMQEIMDLVKVTEVKHRLIKNLSKGYKQRVGLAQALVGGPEVLVLDEPTVGLDPKQIIEIRKLIKALGKEHTIILSSHILPEVSAICDRVIIINQGQIVAIDTPDNLSKGMGGSGTKVSIRIAGPQNSVDNLLRSINGVKLVEAVGKKGEEEFEFLVESEKDLDIRKPIFFELAKKGYPIMELHSVSLTLEDIFLQLTTQEQEVE